VDDLNALPYDALVMDRDGDVWEREADGDYRFDLADMAYDSDELVEAFGPIRLVDNPSES
jgi:hypothetical protein